MVKRDGASGRHTANVPPRARRWLVGGAIAAIAVGALALAWPRLRLGPAVEAPAWAAGIRAGRLTSQYCIDCHAQAGADWVRSLHHLANRKFEPTSAGAGFAGQTLSTYASDYEFRVKAGQPLIRERGRASGATRDHAPSMVIAHATLRQFVIEMQPGRFQATEVAWDPHRREWFGVFGAEERNYGEWGHWTGQSMNWNSMCARCHMTAFDKGYDSAQDRYASSWIEHGVGCVQCHGPLTDHQAGGGVLARTDQAMRDPARAAQTCAGCHARAEELGAAAPPGSRFDDHFRLQLMDDGQLYYADGQVRDEDFEWGSFRHSRMSVAGVTCLDCHEAHSGKLKLSAADNSVCMQCHGPGGRSNAPTIDPAGHSRHRPGSGGSRCVECHMVETTYMQRDPRRDHGFIVPDPVLTQELGIPNACSRCHADRSLEWIIEAWRKRYRGSARQEQRRVRTRAVARGYRGDASVVPELLGLMDGEGVPAWRASLLTLADRLAPGADAVAAAARRWRADPDPLVRAAAVRALGQHLPSRALVREALRDPARLVRVDAEWALSAELAAGTAERREIDAYLDASSESPAGLLHRAQDRFRLGRRDEAIADLRRAITLDPLSAPLPQALGFMLNAEGGATEAAHQFERAAQLAPGDALPAYYAALAWFGAGERGRGEAQLREAVRRDPHFGRAWYNLGLLLSQSGRTAEALDALERAEAAAPDDADVPYARATIDAQAGRRKDALAAARRALAINPRHGPAAALLRTLEAVSRSN